MDFKFLSLFLVAVVGCAPLADIGVSAGSGSFSSSGGGAEDSGGATTSSSSSSGGDSCAAGAWFGGPPEIVLSAGDGPRSVVVGDIDGDGRLDAVLIGRGAVYVARGHGDFAFEAPVAFPTGGNSYLGAIGDVDGDGRLDVVTINPDGFNSSAGFIGVMRNQGDGALAAAATTTAGDLTGPAPVVVDLDGDHRADVAVLTASAVRVFFSEGAALLSAPVDLAGTAQGLVALDADGDGVVDLAATSGPNVLVYRNHGDRSFGAPAVYPLPPSVTQAGVIGLGAGDVDGDGKPDLVVFGAALDADAIAVLRSQGDGTFAPAALTPPIFAGSYPGFAVGDVDGDGRADAIVTDYLAQTVQVFVGGGGGALTLHGTYSAGAGASEPAIADLNGDGRPDLLIADLLGDAASVLPGAGGGVFSPALDMYAAGPDATPVAVASADLDGDGHPDVVTAGTDGIVVLRNDGAGHLGAPAAYATGGRPGWVEIADLNHDGLPDIIVRDWGLTAGVSVLQNQGGGVFGAAASYPGGEGGDSAVAVADVDGDGAPDLVTAGAVLLNHGDGTFAAAVPNPATYFGFSAADVNGDGRADLVWGPDGKGAWVMVSWSHGDGTAEPAAQYALGAKMFGATTGDLDGDGHLDLVVSETTGAIAVLRNQGDGTFGAATEYESLGAGAPRVVDVNGDGHPDVIAFASTYGDGIVVLLNQGDGTLAAPVRFQAGSSASTFGTGKSQPPAVADLDGDGHVDLLAAGTGTGTVNVLRGTVCLP